MSQERRFDHQEAADRHAAGESYVAISRDLGVTPTGVSLAVRRLTDPEFRARNTEAGRLAQQKALRQPCVRGCGRLAWRGAGREGRCRTCSAIERTENARPESLRCCECHEWKPDAAFPFQAASVARRGRHAVCRPCQTTIRRRARERAKVPCSECGNLRLAAKDCGARAADTGLCRRCYLASRRRAK